MHKFNHTNVQRGFAAPYGCDLFLLQVLGASTAAWEPPWPTAQQPAPWMLWLRLTQGCSSTQPLHCPPSMASLSCSRASLAARRKVSSSPLWYYICKNSSTPAPLKIPSKSINMNLMWRSDLLPKWSRTRGCQFVHLPPAAGVWGPRSSADVYAFWKHGLCQSLHWQTDQSKQVLW